MIKCWNNKYKKVVIFYLFYFSLLVIEPLKMIYIFERISPIKNVGFQVSKLYI